MTYQMTLRYDSVGEIKRAIDWARSMYKIEVTGHAMRLTFSAEATKLIKFLIDTQYCDHGDGFNLGQFKAIVDSFVAN